LRETIQSGSDEAAVRSASKKVAEVEADLAVQRAKLHAKLKPILTADQLEKIAAFEEKLDNLAVNAIRSMGEKIK
jgi:Spy/CpxP family protein refolding chaperone